MFLIVMVIGLVGLAMMAIPAFGRHGAGPAGHGHAALGDHGAAAGHALPAHGHVAAPAAAHVAAPAHAPVTVPAHAPVASPAHAPVGSSTGAGHGSALQPSRGHEMLPADAARSGVARWVPSPRAIFTVLALYGAFGNALLESLHLTLLVAALVAVVPTLLVERFAVRPLWNLLFRFQSPPSGPLEELILGEARAVSAFRNGRGIVATNREGRVVQLRARLCDAQAALPVKVGDRLRIEDVDAARERVTVSLLPKESDS